MDFVGGDKYDFSQPGEKATIENVIQIWSVLFKECGLTGEVWRDLRESLYNYVLGEIRPGWLSDCYTLDEMASKIWAFYQGYMACQRHWNQEMDKFVQEIQKKYSL